MKIGQRVVCIKTSSLGGPFGDVEPSEVLHLGQQYNVRGLRTCSCGAECVDVGLRPACGTVGTVCNCGVKWIEDIWWLAAERFAPIEEKSDTNIEEFFQTIPALTHPTNREE